MRFDRRFIEVDCHHRRAGCAGEKARQRPGDCIGLRLRTFLMLTSVAGGRDRTSMRFEKRPGEIRGRDVIATQRFRQRTYQGRGLFLDQSGHQPTDPCAIDRVEQMQRDVERDAVIVGARLESIMQREPHVAQREILGKPIEFAALARQQIGERPLQRFLSLARQLAVPTVQALRGIYFRR